MLVEQLNNTQDSENKIDNEEDGKQTQFEETNQTILVTKNRDYKKRKRNKTS